MIAEYEKERYDPDDPKDGTRCPDCNYKFQDETYPYCPVCKVRWD